MLYQMHRAKGSPDKPVGDWMPDFGRDEGDEEGERPTPEALKAKLMGFTAAAGGTFNHHGSG